ncbi:MAG: TonB-dependent receptor [Bacteroidales bacterium]|nr:TonB-dependent receptor [Bacteroidales bacterium]
MTGLNLMRSILIMLLGFTLLTPTLQASNLLPETLKQDASDVITGIVTDALNGEALPGVSILIKGTTTGTITDVDGNYSVEAKAGDILVFSFIGYLDEEITVGTSNVLNIELSPSLLDLDEVVVIGYGVQKKKLSTGANMHLGSEELTQKKTLRLEQALQGLAPGVNITANGGQPGEDLRVNIRGLGTVGNSSPLYVVDGMVTDNVRFLNPADIESIDILKDAASSSIYGARAANGVILITTKKGEQGKLRVSFDSYMGVQNTPKKLDMLGASDYLMIQNEQRTNMGFTGFYPQELIDTIGEGTDWQDYMFRKNAPTASHVFAMNGGNETSVFSTSISYFKQEGIIGPDTMGDSRSNYQRISLRLNSEHKLYNDRVRIGQNLVYSREKQEGVRTESIYGNNTVRNFLNTSPTFPAYSDTTSDGFGVSWIPQLAFSDANPLAALYYNFLGVTERDKLLGNMFIEVEPLKGFTFTSRMNIDLGYELTNEYNPIYHLNSIVFNDNSRAIMEMRRDFTYNWENFFQYTHTFGKHRINALLGNTLEEYNGFWVRGEKENLVINDFDNAILDGATNSETQVTSGGKVLRRLASFYGRVNYDYDEKYLFSAIYRADGSSKFGPDNKFGYFPSFSAGWVISEEDFFNVSFIDFLKIRGSWGRNGNDKILDYMYEATIASVERDYYFGAGDEQYVGASPEKIHNSALKWETSEQTNIGIDSRFAGFNFVFDIYRKTTKDWLIIAPVSDLAGTEAPTVNGGDVRNQGIELMLSYRFNVGDFSINVSGNMAMNQNEVLRIDNPEGVIHGEEGQLFHGGQTECYRAEVGYPIGYFWGYETDGVFQTQEEIDQYVGPSGRPIQPSAVPGDVIFRDLSGNGTIDIEDRVMIGNPHPDLSYGFSFDVFYKGFDFALILQGVYGNEVLYGYRSEEKAISNYTTDILNRWTGPGTSNTIPRVTTGAEGNQNYKRISDLYVQDGSYMKVRGLTLGYDFGKGIFRNNPVASQFRIYVTLQNLYTFSNYPGYDPEVGYGDLDETRYENYSIGIDNGYYPTPRTALVGLNLAF